MLGGAAWRIDYEWSAPQGRGSKEYYLGPNQTQTLVSASGDFPFKRVARLRSPRAETAYAAFSSFHARGAFDHDFAKGIGKESEEGAPPPSENC